MLEWRRWGEVGGGRSEMNPAGMPGLWCGAQGYCIKILQLLTGLCLSLDGIHLHLVLLMLLLQLLLFSVNRKERGQCEATGCCYSATELCCSRGKRLNIVRLCVFTPFPARLPFRKPCSQIGQIDSRWKHFIWTKHRAFLSHQGALISCGLPTMLKVKTFFWMLLGQWEF